MSSTEPLSNRDRTALLEVARASIQHGLRHGRALDVNPGDYPETLRPPRATFVRSSPMWSGAMKARASSGVTSVKTAIGACGGRRVSGAA